MTLCFPYRTRDALALVLGTCLLPGCVDPKTIGFETDEAGSEDAGSTDGETDGATSQGPATDDGQTDGTDGSDGSDTSEPCPPISEVAECVECECFDGEWACSNTGCAYDCEGLACGDSCMMCPPEDPECTSPEYEGVCTADGQCVGVPPPKQGFCVGALEPGFEMDISEAGGCADMLVYGFDAADTQGVVLWLDEGLVADAHASGMPVHAEYDAIDPAVSLEVRAGLNVTAMECQDVPVPGVEIDELWLPTGGTVIVDVTATGMMEGFATVEFVDLVLARQQPGPSPITVPSLVLTDVFVGWLPG